MAFLYSNLLRRSVGGFGRGTDSWNYFLLCGLSYLFGSPLFSRRGLISSPLRHYWVVFSKSDTNFSWLFRWWAQESRHTCLKSFFRLLAVILTLLHIYLLCFIEYRWMLCPPLVKGLRFFDQSISRCIDVAVDSYGFVAISMTVRCGCFSGAAADALGSIDLYLMRLLHLFERLVIRDEIIRKVCCRHRCSAELRSYAHVLFPALHVTGRFWKGSILRDAAHLFPASINFPSFPSWINFRRFVLTAISNRRFHYLNFFDWRSFDQE